MKSGGVDRAELIKWLDTLDSVPYVEAKLVLEKARNIRHPDAQWLASLFAPDVDMTRQQMWDVLLQQLNDPRAMFMLWQLEGIEERTEQLLVRAAEAGYAAAQARLAVFRLDEENLDEAFVWAQRAAAQGERRGLDVLGTFYRHGIGCESDTVRAIESHKRAAELECTPSEFYYGTLAFGVHDWERYEWWGRSVFRGTERRNVCEAVLDLLPLFEGGELGRVLHTVARLARHVVATKPVWVGSTDMIRYQRVVELHDAMLGRARRAMDCWSMAGRRCRVVKDIRVMIAKMVWEEPWHWGEEKNKEQENMRTKRDE
jgi:hypothetical protein